MKTVMLSAACALLTYTALPGQTSVGSNAKPMAHREADAASNRELNLRAYVDLLRTDVRKARSQVMGQIMQLDADESAKFWPIYKTFETELTSVGDQVVAVIKEYTANYDRMTAAVADQLAQKLLGIEQQRNELKKKYYARMKEALDAITATRFLQVENQLERLIDLQIAAELPVIREQ